jgi:hypothetical protein
MTSAANEFETENGVDVADARDIVRRQLLASVVVAIAVASCTLLAALRPESGVTVASRNVAVVQQPIFVTPTTHLAAEKQRLVVETP